MADHYDYDPQHIRDVHDPAHDTPGGLNATTIAMVGLVGAILLIVIVFAVEATFFSIEETNIEATEYKRPNSEVAAYLREQQELLRNVRWTDQENGFVAVPIEAAMEAMAEEALQSSEAGS